MPRIGTTFKYGVGGTIFGFLFPTVAIAVDALYLNPGLGPVAVVAHTPLHWIILLAPLVLGFTFTWLGRYVARLADENRCRAALEGELRDAAFRDALTGLWNRTALISHLAEGGVAGRHLLLIDLNRFKFVNDTMGHGAGDALLRGVAANLCRATRDVGSAYRLGGDEFLVLLAPCTEERAAELADGIVTAISTTYDLDVGHVAASASLGIAPIADDDPSGSAALFNADLALYQAKKHHPYIAFYDAGMSLKAKDRLALELDLRAALDKSELFLEFQPIVATASGRLSGFEALLRWRHPKRGLISPLEFIPVAEASGLIVPIGEWVLERACQAAAGWPDHVGLSVNVSIRQLHNTLFADTVGACLARWNMRPERLTLEVTESLFILDDKDVGRLIADLRALGVRFALDDFGTGYSSINHLRSFTFDQVKIDKSFSHTMINDRREARLVKTIVQLGSAFSMPATIEGIETQAELELARSVGIDFAQGYFFARPMGAQQAADYIARDTAAQASDPGLRRAG